MSGLTGTVNTAGSTVTRVADDGSVVTYAYNTTLGKYVSQGQSGATDTLSWNAGTSSWTWTDGASRVQETYNASGQLTTLTDTETGASYSFTRTASQLTVTASDGDVLTLAYSGNALTSVTISEVPPGGSTAVVRQQVSYGYGGQGRLQTVTTSLASDRSGRLVPSVAVCGCLAGPRRTFLRPSAAGASAESSCCRPLLLNSRVLVVLDAVQLASRSESGVQAIERGWSAPSDGCTG